MAQTKKEATRLVYVEGITLESALDMSKKYQNIIFLTDDNKKSNQLDWDTEKEIDENAVAQQENENINDDWDLGLNIVRNGHKYIVVRGINNKHCTFTADGTKYTLRIDQHGLLYLDTIEIAERFIYIGNKAVQNDKFIYDVEKIKNAFHGANEFPSYVKQHYIISQSVKTIGKKIEVTNFVYLAIVQNEEALNQYGYIWLFSDKAALKDATSYKDIGTIIGPHANENRLGWSQNAPQEINGATVITSSPVSNISSNICFAILDEIVPLSISIINEAKFSSVTLDSSISISFSFNILAKSPIIQFDTAFGLLQIAFAFSKKEAVFFDEVSISASYSGRSNSLIYLSFLI